MARKLKRDLTVEEQLARGPLDLPFLMLVLLLTAIGVIMMFSASYADALYNMDDPTYYFMRQGLFAIGGVVIMYIMSKINYQTLRWLSVFALVGSIILLIMVKIPGIGASGGGANRWIRAIGPLPRWQPSEAAKLGVILYFSARLSKRNTEKKRHFDKRTYSGHFLELLEEGNRDGSLHTEYPREIAELLPVLTSLWLMPAVFPATKAEMRRKFTFLGEMLDRMGVPLFDESIQAVVDQFFDQMPDFS